MEIGTDSAMVVPHVILACSIFWLRHYSIPHGLYGTVHFLIMHNIGDGILLCIMRFMQQEMDHMIVTTILG